MQVTETLSEGLKRAYAVIIPAEDIASRRAGRFSEIAKQANLPGFRPGKVPMPIVRQRFGGAVAAEIMEQSINEAAQKLLTDRAMRPAIPPKFELISKDPDISGPVNDLAFSIEFELLPEITLPDFAAFTLTRHVAKVPDAELDEAITGLAQRNRELREILPEDLAARDGGLGAREGDVITIDYLGKIDGEAFQGGTGTDTDVDIGGTGFIPGFAEQLVGMVPGDTKTIEVTFPEAYATPTLAGKAATFDITAKRVRIPVVAPVDDALAEKIGFGTLDEVRTALSSMRQRRLDELTRMRMKRDLLDVLSTHANFAVPEAIADQEFEQIWRNLETSRANATMDEDDKDKPEEQLRTEYRAIAERRVRLGLILGEIGRVNTIVVTPDELSDAIRLQAGRYPGQEAQMMEFYRTYPAAVQALRGPIFEDKVVQYVFDAAQVTEVEISVAELERDPDEAKPEVPVSETAVGETSPAVEAGGNSP